MDARQKAAVTAEDKRVLVLAGAGAGKTRTLRQKIMYLIQEKHTTPDQIMAITFTKNAANEMIDRLILAVDTDGYYHKMLTDKTQTKARLHQIRLQKVRENKWINKLTIRTFHSLCYSIIKTYGAKEYDNQFKLLMDDNDSSDAAFTKLKAPESQYEVLHKILIRSCDNRDYLLQFKKYVIDYLIERIHVKIPTPNHQYPEGKYYTSLREIKSDPNPSNTSVTGYTDIASITYMNPRLILMDTPSILIFLFLMPTST